MLGIAGLLEIYYLCKARQYDELITKHEFKQSPLNEEEEAAAFLG